MSNKNAEVKTSKSKKMQVFVNGNLQFESNKPEEALNEVHKMQAEDFAEIVLVNHLAQVSHVYAKGRYEKNYRIAKGEYPMTFPVAVQETE